MHFDAEILDVLLTKANHGDVWQFPRIDNEPVATQSAETNEPAASMEQPWDERTSDST